MHFRLFLALVIALALFPSSSQAYIGPGAGFAFLGSSLVFLMSIFLALATLLLWPAQWLWRKIKGKGVSSKSKARRVVIVGLDGLEPSLVEAYMAQDKLPNLKALKESGSYSRLGTTLPALSPVAWSTFQTGVNPGAHNIFDFLTRDKRYYLPILSSTETTKQNGTEKVHITRKSKPFWNILGEHGIFSNVIRVPISYPPEKFEGNILSAMCTPDLKGTQGSFSFFTTDKEKLAGEKTGGEISSFRSNGKGVLANIMGPPHPSGNGNLSVELHLEANGAKDQALLTLGEKKVPLQLNKFSDWIELEFKEENLKPISGIARFCLRQIEPHLELYVSPLNVNPESPALPIAEPIYFASWLSRKQGMYGTLGLMEDTWGRNEHALDDSRFLEQTYLTHAEREKMFFQALDKTTQGLCVCVFDASDRIQHMFWRYLDEQHPSPREDDARMKDVIPEMYENMDKLIGKVRTKLKPSDLLIVLSDHGFASFRRGVNLNTWLWKEGYLKLKADAPSGADYLHDVDWSNTKAFALGLSGIYVNKHGREHSGILDEEQSQQIKEEIIKKLAGLKDPQDGAVAVSRVYDSNTVYSGLYADEAPDLIVGYMPGYRVSWESVTGGIENEVFSNNLKAWSGDHHIDPKLIPGILFSSKPLKKKNPHIRDIAPTVLDTFALIPPSYMEGKVIL